MITASPLGTPKICLRSYPISTEQHLQIQLDKRPLCLNPMPFQFQHNEPNIMNMLHHATPPNTVPNPTLPKIVGERKKNKQETHHVNESSESKAFLRIPLAGLNFSAVRWWRWSRGSEFDAHLRRPYTWYGLRNRGRVGRRGKIRSSGRLRRCDGFVGCVRR